MILGIIGSGGFAREILSIAKCYHPSCVFFDTDEKPPIHKTPVLSLKSFNPDKYLAVIAVGDPKLRQKIASEDLPKNTEYVSLIHPNAKIGYNVTYGKGTIITANCILTCDIKLGDFAQLNLATTIGHDVTCGDYFTTAPGVHISGNVEMGSRVYFGTNSSTIEKLKISDDVTIGASACVTKSLNQPGIYIGTPARKMEK